MPLQGDAKREYQRVYMRGRRNPHVQAVAEAITAVIKPRHGRPRIVSQPVQEAAQAGLALALRSNKLDLGELLPALREKVQARRMFNAAKIVNGKSVTEAIAIDDNDAQLRAIEQALDLHAKAGTIPTATQPAGGAGGLHYHLHLTELAQPECSIPAIDAAPDADQRVIDAQVLDSSDDA